jgi:hypothetical protein
VGLDVPVDAREVLRRSRDQLRESASSARACEVNGGCYLLASGFYPEVTIQQQRRCRHEHLHSRFLMDNLDHSLGRKPLVQIRRPEITSRPTSLTRFQRRRIAFSILFTPLGKLLSLDLASIACAQSV